MNHSFLSVNSEPPNPWSLSCVTCLSRDRKLWPLSQSPKLKKICNGVELQDTDRVCWECRAILLKLCKFQYKAHMSKAVLSNIAHNMQDYTTHSMDSINHSELKCKSLFNYEFHPDTDLKAETLSNDLEDNSFPEEDMSPEDISNIFHTLTLPIHSIEVKKEIDFDYEIEDQKAHSEALNIPTKTEIKSEKVKTMKGMYNNKIKTDSNKKDSKKMRRSKRKDKDGVGRNVLTEQRFIIKKMNEQEMWKAREAEKTTERFKNNPFRCEKCIQFFKLKQYYINHMQLHSESAGRFTCRICEQRSDSLDDYTKHVSSHYYCFECRSCGYKSHSKYLAQSHWRLHHDTTLRRCADCGECFKSKREYANHRITNHKKKATCEVCGKVLKSKYTLREHMRRHYVKEESVECNVCNKKFRRRFTLNKHMKDVHSDNQTDIDKEACFCVECNKQYKSIHTYTQHLLTSLRHVSREDYKFICDDCDKRFNSKTALRTHIEIWHIKKSDYVCNICGMAYNAQDPLRKHIRKKHSGLPREKKFSCEICGKCFVNRVSLTQHNYSHTDARPYKCRLCSATFNYSGALFKHNTLKHKAKRRCDSIEATNRVSLTQHNYSHTDARPYKCQLCSATFNYSGALFKHNTLKHKAKRRCDSSEATVSDVTLPWGPPPHMFQN